MDRPNELTLRDVGSAAVATVAPGRGGLVTHFELGGRPVLFMDQATLDEPTQNVRGGIPVLFPSPGKLAGDAWAYGGRQGSLKQHGFARNLKWQVMQVSAAAATLRLVANEETLAHYPWDFAISQTITVRDRSLHLEQEISNRSATPMPFGFGFHPYFFVADGSKRETSVTTRATRAFDNVTKQTIDIDSIDLTGREVDLHLIDHGSTTGELRSPQGTIQLIGSPEYTHWVVWTLAGRDFVCLEPWTCPANALNDGAGLALLAPGKSRSMALEIRSAT